MIRAQIEDSLRGTIYDPLIRLILWEGVRSWWSITEWFDCPPASSYPSTSTPSSYLSRFSQTIFGTSENTLDEVDAVVCPKEWARETHKITCEVVYPKDYDMRVVKELNTLEYYGPIRGILNSFSSPQFAPFQMTKRIIKHIISSTSFVPFYFLSLLPRHDLAILMSVFDDR